MRDDLLQRRVIRQEAFDEAGVLGLGAGKFRRSRRAIGLRVSAVKRQTGEELVRAADHRVEALVRVGRVQFREVAGQVGQLDGSVIITPAQCQRERVRDVQGVGEVEAPIIVLGDQIAWLEVFGRFDDDATAGDDEAVADLSQLARSVVFDLAVIVAGADQELVRPVEHLRLLDSLHRTAVAARILVDALDGTQGIRDVGRNGVSVRVFDLFLHDDAVLDFRHAQDCRVGRTWHRLGEVAIDDFRLELSVIGETGERQRLGCLHAGGQCRHDDFEVGVLGTGERSVPVQVQKVNRRRSNDTR